MSYSSMSYSIEGRDQLLNQIEKILEALDECQFLGLDISREQDNLVVSSDYGGIDYVVEWTAIVNKVLEKIGYSNEQYKITGVIDYDCGYYNAFCIDSNINEIRMKEQEFDSEESVEDDQEEGLELNEISDEAAFLISQGIELDDDYFELIRAEEAEIDAFKSLEGKEYTVVTGIDIDEKEFEELMETLADLSENASEDDD